MHTLQPKPPVVLPPSSLVAYTDDDSGMPEFLESSPADESVAALLMNAPRLRSVASLDERVDVAGIIIGPNLHSVHNMPEHMPETQSPGTKTAPVGSVISTTCAFTEPQALPPKSLGFPSADGTGWIISTGFSKFLPAGKPATLLTLSEMQRPHHARVKKKTPINPSINVNVLTKDQ